jgi:hypothetical protein
VGRQARELPCAIGKDAESIVGGDEQLATVRRKLESVKVGDLYFS